MKRLFVAVPLALAMACGGAPNPIAAIAPASAQSVSMQQSDVPSGLSQCSSDSGDVTKVGTQDKTTQQEWQKQQAAGAKAGYVSIFTNSASSCKSLSGGNGASGPNEKLLGSVVIQYKDDASAATAYTSGVFGFKPTDTKQMQGATTGDATGLGPNSAFASQAIQSTSFSVAIWQNKSFVCFLIGWGVTSQDAKTAASDMNGRIH
ncbi:MAG TPA: hypothetical protein VF134_02050 [Candidatus Dormibacteraeota bacterium]